MHRTTLLFLLLLAAAAGATTWHIELDGGSDFTRLQPAIDAAADGDTLLLGPGRFDDEVVLDVPGYSGHLAQANLGGKSLTLIGSGVDSTIIGPEVHEGLGDNDPRGLVSWPRNSGHTVLEDLQVQNVRDGVNLSGGSLRMERCKVTGTEFGLFLTTDGGALIADSAFIDNDTAWVPYMSSENTRIEGCDVDNCSLGLNTLGSGTVDVARCSIRSKFGLNYLATNGTVQDCEIELTWVTIGYGVHSQQGSQVILEDTVIRGGLSSLDVDLGGVLTGTRNILTGASWNTISLGDGWITLSDSHILGDGEYKVYGWRGIAVCVDTAVDHVDLRNNYWGDTTSEAIAASILDWNDDSRICRIVDYAPFYPIPVENEVRSWGAVKSLFR